MAALTHLKYLASFYFPCCVVVFLSTGPHDITHAMLWTTPLWLMIVADFLSQKIDPSLNRTVVNHCFYDAILYLLTATQFLIIGLLLLYASQLHWDSMTDSWTSLVNLVVLRILVGTTSGSSAIIVAHELIHRSQRHMRLMGRLLLYTVCYEHFIISHLKSHHLTVATPEDIATARRDESFKHYWRRVFKGHFFYAWRSEMNRLGLSQFSLFNIHQLTNSVLQGLTIEVIWLTVIVIFFGWVAAFIFLIQALSGVRLLETINYYQHWGLEHGKKGDTLAWVNQSSISEYALVGLSNHIAHHQNSTTFFQETPYSSQGPIMPYGYFVTNLWVKLNNASYRKASKDILEQFFLDK